MPLGQYGTFDYTYSGGEGTQHTMDFDAIIERMKKDEKELKEENEKLKRCGCQHDLRCRMGLAAEWGDESYQY